jgi:quercetin dioxygenase-like cupin family protein
MDKKEEVITSGLGICRIYEKHPLRISLYYIPAGETMKLHDHPGMEVISYLFKGKM